MPIFFDGGETSISLISLIYFNIGGNDDSPSKTDKKSKKDVFGHYWDRGGDIEDT